MPRDDVRKANDGQGPPSTAEGAGPHPYQDLDRIVRALIAEQTGGVSPFSILEAWTDWSLHLTRAPGRQLELAEKAWLNALAVWADTVAGKGAPPPFAPKPHDHRFTHRDWARQPFRLWQQAFLATHDWWDHATDALRGLNKPDSDRVNFMVRQILDVWSPSNNPAANPEILERTRACRGANLVEGARHFAEDFAQTVTQARKPPPKGFEIGRDLAATPGKVVFRNHLFELIQYAPATGEVQAEPVLIVPAWIMKYYVLDLSPENSLIRYLVAEGFTVFAISWMNPKREDARLSLEDYRTTGVMAALDVVGRILPGRKVHATGYCLGGTILAVAAATMARDGDDRLASVTLMAAQVDFSEAGELLLFLDESQVAFLEDMMWARGYLDRPQMTRAFATIRAEDLIYSRAVRRYFLGIADLPTDLTVWNNDTTRMPAVMHGEYLRSLFLENRLTAGRFAVEGRVIALKDLDVPHFVIGTETDHIAPWRSVYKLRLFTDCDLTFVLTSSGHNGGILSEPGHKGRHYRIGRRAPGARYLDPDTWLARHAEKEGSWWPEWAGWLRRHSTDRTMPPDFGAPGLPPLADAPGDYVFQT